VVNEVCRGEFLADVRARSQQLASGLQAIVREFGLVGERGAGLLRALVLPGDDAERVVLAARHLQPTGLLLNAPRRNVIRLMPALTVRAAEVDEALDLLRQALRLAAPAG
jgi:acetylornithine/N-succinyldiaminopimelate aminotransferase